MFQNTKLIPAALLTCGVLFLASCSKDDPGIQPYTVPDTYVFSDADYSEAASRVSMWAGLTSYLSKGTTRILSQDTANYLWNNTNSAFTAEVANNLPYNYTALNGLSYNIASKSADASAIKVLVDSMVKISLSNTATASNGIAGKMGSRLFNYSGLEFNQAVAKGLMGSFQLYQVVSLLNKVASDDNNAIVAGQGTAMQHDWDLAFGYVGIPKDYDSSLSYTNTTPDRPLAVGGYFKERARHLQLGGKVYEAFRKGRAAIGAKDYAVRDQAITAIKEGIEQTIAAACYAYAGKGQTDATLDSRFHSMSEGAGFVLALKYRSAGSKLTEANYLALAGIFNTNFYDLDADASKIKLKQAQDILTAAYGPLAP